MREKLIPWQLAGWTATRGDALSQLEAFLPIAGRYARDRNFVVPGHPHVSRLSPAVRYRLILEAECVEAALSRFSASTVEKFVQEVYWRRYWKNWLSLRPQVWTKYVEQLAVLRTDPDAAATRARAACCEAGQGAVSIMNHFARELVETGYLHNHARMWFAGWWIHIERLPWQLGADFFLRHLLDGDPASNTLSWRWVAGLQTPGKTYLPRRSNLEKYLPAEVLEGHQQGLEQLEAPQGLILPSEARPAITRPSLPPPPLVREGRIGLWMHEEDLFLEQSPLASLRPRSILATGDITTWNHLRYPERKVAWLQTALADAADRASSAFNVEAQVETVSPFLETLLHWASEHRLDQVVAMRPEIGPLHDQIPATQVALRKAGIDLLLYDRTEDLALRPLATDGFFGFWEKMEKMLVLVACNNQPEVRS